MTPARFKINHYSFDSSLFDGLSNNHFAKDLWPLVYILSDEESKTAYVGETTDAYARMATHLKHNKKSKLTSVHLIGSEQFNKSATLDIESNLIKYMSGDSSFQLLNGNLGLANHNYYQKKEVYWKVFQDIWNKLRSEGIARHSIEHIDNSDLFKYSPYKSLTKEQSRGLTKIMASLASGSFQTTVVDGGAGTGKTILAIFLFKMLSEELNDFNFSDFGEDELEIRTRIEEIKMRFPKPKMALIVPMSSFRKTLKKVFKNIKGLSASMVIGPAEVAKEQYDIVVVDESHRLRRRKNLGAYFGAFDKACVKLGLDKHKSNELEWTIRQAKNTILFYDADQSIKPSDVRKQDFDQLIKQPTTQSVKLKSQFRVRGGNAYVEHVDAILNSDSSHLKKFKSSEYEFLLFDSLSEMVKEIKSRDEESGLSRLIAGYSWEWISKKNPDAYDIRIGDVELKWNSTAEDWINKEGSINEVGCIHTTQGYDLNYSGIIFGNEITYNPDNNEIEVISENYFDKNGSQGIKDPSELKAFILNIYKTIMLRGIKGTYVYACDPNLRAYLKQLIPPYRQESMNKMELLDPIDVIPFENAIPLFDLKVAAGSFGEYQKVDDVQWIKSPEGVRIDDGYFACQVVGESMNKIITNGSICLFKKYTGGSRNGQIIIAESTSIHDEDFGSSYTVKEYSSTKDIDQEGWKHTSIILKPQSTDESYETIILEDDELESFRVVGVFDRVLY